MALIAMTKKWVFVLYKSQFLIVGKEGKFVSRSGPASDKWLSADNYFPWWSLLTLSIHLGIDMTLHFLGAK